MTKGITFQTKVHFRAGRNGRKHLETGATPTPPVEPGRVPRVSRIAIGTGLGLSLSAAWFSNHWLCVSWLLSSTAFCLHALTSNGDNI